MDRAQSSTPTRTCPHSQFFHEHFHPQEEVYEVIEGALELTIDGVKQVARPGIVGIVLRHSIKAAMVAPSSLTIP